MPEIESAGTYVGQEFGNYLLTSLVGKGGFAEVYLGEHVYLKTQAAIKVLQTRLASEEQERFYIEAQTVAHLQHEHIVRVLEFGLKDNSIPFLVMEYAPNGTLRERFPRGIAIPLEQILSPLQQVANALQYAHNANLIHRDIKPENMLLGTHGEVLLGDFGIALMIRSSHHQDKQEVAGTITYMAPEQLQGRPVPASDQYALGIIVYEWLSGQRLFSGSFTAIATQHMLTPAPSLQGRIPDITAAVDQVVLKALAKDPQQRFANIQDFVSALVAAAQGYSYSDSTTPLSLVPTATTRSHAQLALPVQIPPPQASLPSTSIAKKPKARLSRQLKLALLLLALILVIGSGISYRLFRPQQPTKTDIQQEMQTLYTNATREEPQIEDSLNTESPLAWLLVTDTDKTCNFTAGALHTSGKGVSICSTAYLNLSNFVFQAQVTILEGKSGGLIFRNELIPHPDGGIYYFSVTIDGKFSLSVRHISYINQQFTSSGLKILLQQSSTAIKTGFNQTNLLTVIARGSSIFLYINKHFVGNVQDSTWLSGTVGLFSQGESINQSLDVAFKNMQIWIL